MRTFQSMKVQELLIMSHVSFVLLVVIGVLCSTTIARSPTPRCPKNQEWTDCGTACPLKCNAPPKFCILLCIEGCQCKPGYLLNDKGCCVLPLQC